MNRDMHLISKVCAWGGGGWRNVRVIISPIDLVGRGMNLLKGRRPEADKGEDGSLKPFF